MRELTAEREQLQRKLALLDKVIAGLHDEFDGDEKRITRIETTYDRVAVPSDRSGRPVKRYMSKQWRENIGRARRAYWRKWRKENGKR
jgi:hypothetical protein